MAGEGRLPLNLVQQGPAPGAQGAAGARGQHGGVNLHLLVKGAEFDGGDGEAAGVQTQREGHVAEDVLGSEVDALPCGGYQLHVSQGRVVWEPEIRLNMSACISVTLCSGF